MENTAYVLKDGSVKACDSTMLEPACRVALWAAASTTNAFAALLGGAREGLG